MVLFYIKTSDHSESLFYALTFLPCEGFGLIQKLCNVKPLKTTILKPPDTYTHVGVSVGYSMLVFKSFALYDF